MVCYFPSAFLPKHSPAIQKLNLFIQGKSKTKSEEEHQETEDTEVKKEEKTKEKKKKVKRHKVKSESPEPVGMAEDPGDTGISAEGGSRGEGGAKASLHCHAKIRYLLRFLAYICIEIYTYQCFF